MPPPEVYDAQIGPTHERLLDATSGVMSRAPGPPHDVITVREHGAQRSLVVAIPELLAPPSPVRRSHAELPHHEWHGRIQPDQYLAALEELRAHSRVLPLRDPPALLSEGVCVLDKRLPWRPGRAVEERVDLGVGKTGSAEQRSGQPGLA